MTINQSRQAVVRVIVIACALCVIAFLILDAAGVKGWDARAVAAVAATVVAVAEKVAQDSLVGALKKRADSKEERARSLFMPRGRLPRVREITDPVTVGARPASPRPPAERPPDGRDRVPAYVARDVDAPLRGALARGGFVLLVGEATAGKTRTAFEAVRAELPGHLFISPSVLADVASAAAAAAAERSCVLWLDNLPLFLGPGGLTRKSIAELMDGTDHHRVIVATMRAADESRLTVGDTAGAPLAGAGAVGPSQDGGLGMRVSQGVVDQADHRFFVERLLTAAELGRAAGLAARDSRLAGAIRNPRDTGLGEYLASGPQLFAEWQDARSRGRHPRGAALVAAAVDCRRAGYAGPLPRLLLEELHHAYLDEYGSQVYPERLSRAWTWAVSARDSGSAPLRYTGAEHCDVFGYLIDEFERRSRQPAPESTVRTALSYAGLADASVIANTAWRQGRYQLAEAAIRVVYDAVLQIADPDDPDVLAIRNNLAVVLQDQGKLAQAEAEYRAILAAKPGPPSADRPEVQAARSNLAAILYTQGKLTEAGAEYRAIMEAHRRALGPEHPETLTARNNVAAVLHAQGRLAEAEAEYQAVRQARITLLGMDHRDTLVARHNHALVLADLGRLGEAEQELGAVLAARERVLGPGHPHTRKSRDDLALVARRRSAG